MSSEKAALAEVKPPVAVAVQPPPSYSPEIIKPSKRCCTKKVLLISLAVVFLLLAGLFIAGFFLYPRKLDLRVKTFSKNMLQVEIQSENYIDITINTIEAEVIFDQIYKVANLNKDQFKIKGRGTTLVEIPVYNLTIPDAAIHQCIAGDALKLQIHVTVDPKLLSWTGKKFSFTVNQSISCSDLIGQGVTPYQMQMAQRYPTVAKRLIRERL